MPLTLRVFLRFVLWSGFALRTRASNLTNINLSGHYYSLARTTRWGAGLHFQLTSAYVLLWPRLMADNETRTSRLAVHCRTRERLPHDHASDIITQRLKGLPCENYFQSVGPLCVSRDALEKRYKTKTRTRGSVGPGVYGATLSLKVDRLLETLPTLPRDGLVAIRASRAV